MRQCYVSFFIFLCSCSSIKEGARTRICLHPPELIKVVDFSWDDVPNLPRMQGTWIKIEGYFSCHFEDVAVYSSTHSLAAHGISILFKYEIVLEDDKLLQTLDGKKVVVYGRLDPNGKRPLGYKAMIDSAYCIEELK